MIALTHSLRVVLLLPLALQGEKGLPVLLEDMRATLGPRAGGARQAHRWSGRAHAPGGVIAGPLCHGSTSARMPRAEPIVGEPAANTLQPGSSIGYATTANDEVKITVEASLLVKGRPCLRSHGRGHRFETCHASHRFRR